MCKRSRQSVSSRDFAVEITSSDTFVSKDTIMGIQGRIPPEHGQMIQCLLDETDLTLQAICHIDGHSELPEPDRVFVQQPGSLSIAVFGPFELFEEIGTWFQEYSVYLQDPVNVERQDMKYCNPHRLSADDFESCLLVSDMMSSDSGRAKLEEIADRPGFLDILSTRAVLAESPQPTAVRTDLKK